MASLALPRIDITEGAILKRLTRVYVIESPRAGDAAVRVARTVSDYISGMTEREAVELHRRLSGASLGSVLDPLAP